jgi:AraC family transcriptional regulator
MNPATNFPTVWNSLGAAIHLKDSPEVEVKITDFAPFSFARVRSKCGIPDLSLPIVGEQGHGISLALEPVSYVEEFLGKKRVSCGPYAVGSVSAYNLEEQFTFFVPRPFHSLIVYLPPKTLDEIAYAHHRPRMERLVWQQGTIDPVVSHLGQSLVAALDSPLDASKLFVDHVLQAINCHLVWSYGNAAKSLPIFRGGLAPWQMRRSTEIIDAHLDGNITLQELADSCGLSLGHFARAFKASFGKPPHKWLTERRVDRAKNLIINSHLPLFEVAAHCGYPDQSALTRAFKRNYGTTPLTLRRSTTSGDDGNAVNSEGLVSI